MLNTHPYETVILVLLMVFSASHAVYCSCKATKAREIGIGNQHTRYVIAGVLQCLAFGCWGILFLVGSAHA